MGLNSIVPWPLGAFRLTVQNIIQSTITIQYSQCTLPPSLAIRCQIMLLHYMPTWCCYGEMYSTMRRGGYNKCKAVICSGPLGCFSGTVKDFSHVVFLARLWLTRQLLPPPPPPRSVFVHEFVWTLFIPAWLKPPKQRLFIVKRYRWWRNSSGPWLQ